MRDADVERLAYERAGGEGQHGITRELTNWGRRVPLEVGRLSGYECEVEASIVVPRSPRARLQPRQVQDVTWT